MRIALVSLTLAIALSALAPASRAGDAEPRPGIVGSAVCADCHPGISDSWARTGHALTFQPATAERLPPEVRGGGSAIHPPGRSRFFRRNGGFQVLTTGDDGQESPYPLTDVVGVRRIRMYLTRLPDGRRQVLPGMLDQTRNEWFDYTHLIFGVPGTDPAVPPKVRPGEPTFWTGMPRFFDARCAVCHTTGFEFRVPEGGKGDWAVWKERGVGCESCHGGGAGHVALQNGEAPAGAADPMVAQRSWTRQVRVSRCYRCHMEGEPVTGEFAPGDDWYDHFQPTLLDDEERVDAAGRPLELIYDGAPFEASRCATVGGLTCATCHDPHGGPYRAQLRTPPGDPALCTSCHEDVAAAGREHHRHDPEQVGASCVGCHMPPLTIERGHGIVTDHTIGVPNPDFPGRRVAKDACTTCHSGARGAPGGVPKLADERVREAFRSWWPDAPVRPAVSAPIRAARTGDGKSVPALAKLALDGSAPRIYRASAARLLGRFPDRALPHLLKLSRAGDSVVRRSAADALGGIPGETADALLLKMLYDDSPAVRSRAARAALRGWERVRRNRRLLETAIDVLAEDAAGVPQDDARWFRLGAARQIAGDDRGAVSAYERKLQLDPYAKLVRKTVEELDARIAAEDE